MNTSYHTARFAVIGAGLALGTGTACSLLTQLDAPIEYARGDGGDGALEDAETFDEPPVRIDACSVSDACGTDAAPPFYAAAYVSQSFPLATTALTMTEGQVISSYIILQNVGVTPWDSNTQLGTTDPENRVSPFADGTWISPDRPAAVKGIIEPNSSYKFTFDLKAPQMPGTYYEHFGPLEVVDILPDGGTKNTWFSAPGQGGPPADDIEAQIVVVAPK